MLPGTEVFFPVWSAIAQKELEFIGRVLCVNQNGTLRVRSSSGLIEVNVPADRIRTVNGGSDLIRTVAPA